MKKGWGGLIFLLWAMTFAAYGQDTSVNVNTIVAPELASAPTIDGNLDEEAWGPVPAIPLTGSGDDPAATTPGNRQ